jgi:two-component system copper resistance phosphate regulon response regulator CusR
MTPVNGARNAHHFRPASRILVVDDEAKLRSFVCRALAAEGFSVDGAGDGARALQLIQERDYDLVILDLLMEGVDGATVLERALQVRPGLPVLVLSALSDVETKVRCFELGASDYMTKPFALAELRARIWARLPPPADAEERIVTYDGLRLDPAHRTVETDRGTVRLSRTEFELLSHLIRFEGRVFSRAELLDAVWGYSFDPGTNVVDVYVARLRSKLGSSVIGTVRNVGYYVPVA